MRSQGLCKVADGRLGREHSRWTRVVNDITAVNLQLARAVGVLFRSSSSGQSNRHRFESPHKQDRSDKHRYPKSEKVKRRSLLNPKVLTLRNKKDVTKMTSPLRARLHGDNAPMNIESTSKRPRLDVEADTIELRVFSDRPNGARSNVGDESPTRATMVHVRVDGV
ncbi:uncharacterized protein G2W53_039311 [Senna tora]|uniref:Uncharacterized protein n=1 Tax=Senna tora TaxID=362788 RepID=A0A834SQH9_9FABA|nr:uncharacterized protein G2W53_039311 [Senna tora]